MRLGLRQKLIVLVLVILVPLLVLLTLNLARYFADLQSDQLEQRRRDANVVAATLDRFMQDLVQIATTAGLAVAEGDVSPQEASAYLDDVRTRLPVSNVALLDGQGRAIASGIPSVIGTDLSGLPAFQSVVAGAPYAVTDLRRNASGELGFAVFVPVKRNGAVSRVSVVAVDSDELAAVIPPSISQGAVLISDSNGALVYSNRPEYATLTEQERRDWESPGVRVALSGREFVTRSARLPQLPGIWLGAEVPTENSWAVGRFDTSNAAFARLEREVLLNVVVVFVVVGLSLFAARQYGLSVTDPLERLTDATAEVERGRFDAEVPVSTHDEIGELAENFRLMQGSLKRTVGDVQLLAESGRWMSSTLDLDAVARATDDYLGKILGAEAAVVTLFGDGRPGSFRRLSSRLSPEAAEAVTVQGAEAVRRADLERRGYALIDGVRITAALEGVAEGPLSLFSLPMVVNRQMIGRIDALVPTERVPEFEEADIPLAQSLAQQVAVAAENARLFEQQRAIADTLQDALLTEPYRVPQFDVGLVYHQATVGGRIGGDFYDFIPISPATTAIVIGDITGKGLEAARFTAVGKGAIRAFAIEEPSPSAVLDRANRVIAEQLGAENFITAVCLLLDLEGGCFDYAVAGHPPPMLFRQATGEVELLREGGMPLGIDASETYEGCHVCMDVGDRLMLYTDGLSEARRGRELFGFDRLAEMFGAFRGSPVRDVASGTAEAAIAFAGGSLGDDLAIIVLERCPVPAGVAAGTTRPSARHLRPGS